MQQYYNVTFDFTLDNYNRLFNADYLKIYVQSIVIALVTTLLCILIGYPFSYVIARTKSKRRKILYMLVIIPFWTNSLIRIYGWRTFLGTNGWFNNVFQALHIVNERQFQSGNNWPLGAALSIILILVTLILVKIYQKMGGDMNSLGV